MSDETTNEVDSDFHSQINEGLVEGGMVYDDEPITIPVVIGESHYALQEIGGKERDRYLNFSSGRVDARKKKITNFDGLQTNLLSKGLYFADLEKKDGEWKVVELKDLVPEGEIKNFKARVITQLFEKLSLISGINDGSEAREGND